VANDTKKKKRAAQRALRKLWTEEEGRTGAGAERRKVSERRKGSDGV
jgi:hypothetical protein